MKHILASLCLLTIACSATADEVLFKSGDRLTGTVKSMANGKMVFDSKVAGTITLKMEDIETFSTEKKIDLIMKDGKKVSSEMVGSKQIGRVISGADTKTSLALTDIAKINPPEVKWTGDITAGATFVRGNTESDTASAAFNTSRRSDYDRISFSGQYLYAQEHNFTTKDDDTTTDNWFLKGQYDYFFTKKHYFYGSAKYEKNKIQDLDKRFTPGLGYGYQWIESADMNFKTELGGFWIYERYTDPDETRTYQAARLAYSFDKKLSESLKFYHNMEYIPSLENVNYFLANADVGLQAKLTSSWAVDTKIQGSYNSEPSDDKEKLDMRYIVGLTWKF